MADVERIAQDIRSSRLSSLQGFSSTDDIVNVWVYVSSFIENQLQKAKAVNVGGLGTFTFTTNAHGEKEGKLQVPQRPVFVLSEKFAQQHQLVYPKHHVAGRIPVVDLNYAAIALDSPFSRDTVEQCVHGVVNEFSRALASGRNIDFSFSGVGRLTIRNGKVKMKFLKEFVNSLDSSGKLEESMKNRPDTADSVISRATTARPPTSNTTVLPGIADKKAYRKPGMEVIEEDHELAIRGHGGDSKEDIEKFLYEMHQDETPRDQARPTRQEGKMGEDFKDSSMIDMVDLGLPHSFMHEKHHEQQDATHSAPQMSGRSSRMLAPMSMAGGVNLNDVMPSTSRLAPIKTPMAGMSRPPTAIVSPRRSELPAADDFTFHGPATVRSAPPYPRISSPVDSECGHNAGQELCYLCHQRDRRNIPVSFTEERKRREEQEDRLLHEFQIMKNNEAILNDQEQEIARRHDNQKVAAFNSGIAEAMLEKKHEKPVKGTPPQAYIFQRRPLTPHRSIKQNQLSDYLLQQVNGKESRTKASKAEQEFLERLEQVQLAEDLAAQREQYVREKAAEREKYRAALGAQLKYKPLPVPPRQPDIEVFGKNDTTEADLIARKQHAREIMVDQLQAVANKERANLVQKTQDQQEEEELLNKNRNESLEDRALRHQRLVQHRKALEDDWLVAAEAKRTRELEERLRAVAGCSLVHEQCDRYKRCHQCKKRLSNAGESNVWRESRYIPGARVMV